MSASAGQARSGANPFLLRFLVCAYGPSQARGRRCTNLQGYVELGLSLYSWNGPSKIDISNRATRIRLRLRLPSARAVFTKIVQRSEVVTCTHQKVRWCALIRSGEEVDAVEEPRAPCGKVRPHVWSHSKFERCAVAEEDGGLVLVWRARR